jgi:fatty aldehyde-generating acyl-ACP reductase
MDNQPARINFALIGHQDSWQSVMDFVNGLRIAKQQDALSLQKIKEIYTYIPSRGLFDITVHSTQGETVRGVYIETFISPDELDAAHLRKNIGKVHDACKHAAQLGASVVSLGGFSSIVLETGNESFTKIDNTYFSTGNTLTAAFIAKSVEKACSFWKQSLSDSNLLIIGSTGDIGSACVGYFSGRVKKLLLNARQAGPLQKQSEVLSAKGISNIASSNLKELAQKADVVISVASSIIETNDLDCLPKHAVVCDAGYPKNLQSTHIKGHTRLYHGGMGIVNAGFRFENNVQNLLYKFSLPNVSHGCLLEAIVLAMENQYCAYSKGKGNITAKAMEDILEMADSHGIETAPLFNGSLIIQPTISALI